MSLALLQKRIDTVPRDDESAVNIVDLLLNTAVKSRVTDVHLESQRERMVVKMRIDGRLHSVAHISHDIQEQVHTRIKVLGRLASYRKHQPQDGRLEYAHNGSTYQCRVAFVPTLHGEKAVVRLPEEIKSFLSLEQARYAGYCKKRTG